jgi:hypothetical protein
MKETDTNPVIKLHPSICYKCVNARKPASDENVDEGWVGCAEYARKEHCYFVEKFKELGEGWVDLKASIFGKRSGVITNLQLLTREVEECNSFELKK